MRTAALRALVEDSDEGMILADDLGRILFANAACKRFLGYRPSELVGRLGFDLCRPEHLSIARDAFARCLVHPATPVTLEVDVSQRDGGFRSLAVKLANRLSAPGVKAVVVHFRDATAGAFQPTLPDEREEPHRVLFDHAPVGLGVADMEGNLLAFNEAMLQPGGYTREDMLGITNVSQLYGHAPDRDRVLAMARERGFVWREEVQFRRKDGSSYDTLLTLTPVRFRGRPCWYAMVEDVSERRRAEDERLHLEAQLRQAQKMEAVGRMTSGIAHDFNNVLSVIMTNAELMGSDLGLAEAELRDELAELQRAAERGAAMIRKLLGFSRRADLQPRPTELGDLLVTLRGMLRHIIPEGITLEITSAPGSVALADPAAVEQMVLNLATNARDAMEMSGTVRIDVGPVVIDRGETTSRSWMQPGEFVRLSVADTGMGMDEETRAHALEPFFTTKPAGVGTGLGLPMVYGLIKQHHGYIEIASELGRGTTVSLYFPRAAQDVPAVADAAPSGLTGGHATILLIEDDESLRATTQRVLEHLGYRVFVARDGLEGIEAFRAKRSEIDLVLSDTVMPGMTGPEVYEAIKGENPAARFLLWSGYDERDMRSIHVPPGLTVFRKPWTIPELATKVAEALAKVE